MKLIAAIVLLVGSVAVGQATQATSQPTARDEARATYAEQCRRAKDKQIAEHRAEIARCKDRMKRANPDLKKHLRDKIKQEEQAIAQIESNFDYRSKFDPRAVGDVGFADGTFTIIQIQPDDSALTRYVIVDEHRSLHPSGAIEMKFKEREVKSILLLRGFDLRKIADGEKYRPGAVVFVSGRYAYTNSDGERVTALVVEPL